MSTQRQKYIKHILNHGYPDNSFDKKKLLLWIPIAIVLVLVVCGLCSCKTTGAVTPTITPPQVNTNQYHGHDAYTVDTVYLDRWHTIIEKGDTIYVHDSVTINKFRDRYVTDTFTRADTIRKYINVLDKSQEAWIRWGKIAAGVVAAFILAIIIGIILKFAK